MMRAAGTPRHEVRIIGGRWKRSKLAVADRPGLRPTMNRVRETLFNWLGQDLSGWRCVDCFAGTGALGFEAASRGAQQVLLIERERLLAQQLERTKVRLQATTVSIVCGDGIAQLLRLEPGSVDLVLLDPPFDSTVFDAALRAAARAVTSTGFVYLEAPHQWHDEQLAVAGLRPQRHLKAGAAWAHLLVRATMGQPHPQPWAPAVAAASAPAR